MKKINLVFILVIAVLASGCSINHPIAKDYNQYLLNNEEQSNLPKTGLKTEYLLDRGTITHRYEFRAAIVGYAHLWIVEFGDMLETNLNAKYVQDAFGRLERRSVIDGDSESNLVSFTLENYEFEGFQAHVSLNISLTNGNNEIINKTYHSSGKSQGGKMFWGGPFAMKNATQQSTKLAIDEILSEFIRDVNNKSMASK